MDTLTHALSGALLARATARPGGGTSLRERTLAGFWAAGFPDLDYLLFWAAPLDFLNWHRGLTHSLLLLPVWALVLAVPLARLIRGSRAWRAFYGVCALAILIHIAGDVFTIYGTKVLSPLSDAPLAFSIVFDVDPYVAVLVGAGFIASLRWNPRRAALATLALVAGYFVLQTALYWRTIALGEAYADRQGLEKAQVYALPQPLAPFLWKLVIAWEDRYLVAYIDYLSRKAAPDSPAAGWLGSMLAAYRPPGELRWSEYRRFGDTQVVQSLAYEVWRQDALAAFRRFAVLPALYRVDRNSDGEVCVWFTDLRHNLPGIAPSFRYGMCRVGLDGPWRLYRLRYFRDADRQLIGSG